MNESIPAKALKAVLWNLNVALCFGQRSPVDESTGQDVKVA